MFLVVFKFLYLLIYLNKICPIRQKEGKMEKQINTF